MPVPPKKENPVPTTPKSNRTGEDIDMLHEKESDPESGDDRGNYSYRDNYDAA
jgi:hypothetical protein